MTDSKYSLRYLPLFYEDLKEKLTYISSTLENPQAANNLLDEVEKKMTAPEKFKDILRVKYKL